MPGPGPGQRGVAGQVGRAPRRRPGRPPSPAPTWATRCWRSRSRPGRRSSRRAGPRRGSSPGPARTSSGRPGPCPRRRRASAAETSSVVIATCAGSPSRIATRAGPWDSPAVSQRSMRVSLPCSGRASRTRSAGSRDRDQSGVAPEQTDRRAPSSMNGPNGKPLRSTISSRPAARRSPRRAGSRRTGRPAGPQPTQPSAMPSDARPAGRRRTRARAGRPATAGSRSRRHEPNPRADADHGVRVPGDRPADAAPAPTSTTYVGRIRYVGSSRVRQSITASATVHRDERHPEHQAQSQPTAAPDDRAGDRTGDRAPPAESRQPRRCRRTARAARRRLRRRRVDGARRPPARAVGARAVGGSQGGDPRDQPRDEQPAQPRHAPRRRATASDGRVHGPDPSDRATRPAAAFGESRLTRRAHRRDRDVEAAGHRAHLVDRLPQQQVEPADERAARRRGRGRPSGVGHGS